MHERLGSRVSAAGQFRHATKKKDAPLGGVQVAPWSVARGLKVLTVICRTITAQVYSFNYTGLLT